MHDKITNLEFYHRVAKLFQTTFVLGEIDLSKIK